MIITTDEIPNYERLNTKMRKMYEDAQIDMDLNEMNIREKTLSAIALRAKWACIRFAEENLLQKLKEKREESIEQYSAKYGQMNVPKFATDSEALKSDEIQKIDKSITIQEEVVKFAHELCKIFQGFGFDIKNSVDILKLEN